MRSQDENSKLERQIFEVLRCSVDICETISNALFQKHTSFLVYAWNLIVEAM